MLWISPLIHIHLLSFSLSSVLGLWVLLISLGAIAQKSGHMFKQTSPTHTTLPKSCLLGMIIGFEKLTLLLSQTCSLFSRAPPYTKTGTSSLSFLHLLVPNWQLVSSEGHSFPTAPCAHHPPHAHCTNVTFCHCDAGFTSRSGLAIFSNPLRSVQVRGRRIIEPSEIWGNQETLKQHWSLLLRVEVRNQETGQSVLMVKGYILTAPALELDYLNSSRPGVSPGKLSNFPVSPYL